LLKSEHTPGWRGYNRTIMVTGNPEFSNILEICSQVKELGYAASDRIRLYGEEFEVLSDPFPENDGIAVRVKSLHAKSESVRVLQLPATVLQSVKGRSRAA
jgi:hypothetical protein